MLNTLDNYFDEQNVFNIEIVGTLGQVKADLAEIQKLPGIAIVVGAKF